MNLSRKTNPLVSICIPTFNRESTILDALHCALGQTYHNIEILISDDHSTDKTVKLLKTVKDSRIKLVIQKKNLGMIPNWNFCIQKARGEFIKFLHSDDLIDPGCVEKELNYFLNNKNISLVVCKRNFIDKQGKTIRSMQFSKKTTREQGKIYGHDLITSIRENKIGEPSAVLFRKEDALRAGLFDPQFSQLADFEFWLRLHLLGDIGYINEPLCSFRIHEGSNTSAAIKDGRFIDETYALIGKYYDNSQYAEPFFLSKKNRERVIRQKTLDFLKNIKTLIYLGDISSARQYLSKLIEHVSLLRLIYYSLCHSIKA